MATYTTANNFIVINCIVGNHPGRNNMAGFTKITGVNVACALTSCFCAVMARDTGFCRQAVIKSGNLPGRSGMT